MASRRQHLVDTEVLLQVVGEQVQRNLYLVFKARTLPGPASDMTQQGMPVRICCQHAVHVATKHTAIR